jgi:hypothetical protein
MIDTNLLLQQCLEPLYLKEKSSGMLAYKHPLIDLVFFPNPKCASTHYRTFFVKQKWLYIDIRDIDWNKDIVFAHIINPLKRHRKGIVEGVYNYFPESKDLFFTPTGAKFLSNIPILEGHSYTIMRWFGPEYSTKIHWIPIDTKINHVEYTLDFLSKQGVDINEELKHWCRTERNLKKSTPKEIELYNTLMAYETPGEIKRYLDFDICLYNMILCDLGISPIDVYEETNC